MIPKNKIIELENELYKAILNSDIQTLDNLLHDDLLFLIPSGETITKEIDIKTYSEGNLKINQLIPQIEKIVHIDDLAIVTVQLELAGTYNSESFQSKFRYIRFWKQSADEIKVVGGSGIAI